MAVTLCLLIVSLGGDAAEELRVLPVHEAQTIHDAMLYRYLAKLAAVAIDQRQRAFEQIKTPQQARAWQQARREFFLRQIGGLPEGCPLAAKVVGTLSGDGYRLEKVIYQSRPNHHITGLLYLPLSKPPYPGVLVPCGHSSNGKAAETYQRISILLARNGMAALCYDPIGQGERYQVLNKDGTPLANPDRLSASQLDPIHGRPQFNPVEEHNLVGVGSILLGLSTAAYRIYDGMRGIDYLLSRPEIDRGRIGCTGQSGGGTLTSYLMALDDRIQCAAPACCLTTFRRLIETIGPQDAEQAVFGQLAFGMDQADYVLMHAPKPTCLVAGTRDALFDVTGTWDIFREGKRFYGRFGLPECMGMVEADEPHTFTMPLRVGAVRWLRRWLLGLDDAVSESESLLWTDQQLQCTPQGQVLFLPGERSVFDLNRRLNEALAAQREQFWQATPPAQARQRVRELIGARPLAELPEPTVRSVGTLRRAGCRIEKLVLEPEAGIELPALAFLPARADGDAYLYLDGRGKHVDAAPGGPIETLVRQGHLVLAVDLRSIGETDDLRDKSPSYRYKEKEYRLAYLLGKSLVGMRVEDALVAGRFLSAYGTGGAPRRVHLVGVAAAGVPALHAAALEPELFASLRLRNALVSWSEVLDTSVPVDQLDNTVHGALRVYDLPDLVRTLGPKKVVVDAQEAR